MVYMARKMLIVEDDENISELLSLYMQREGFQTEIAPDGEAALQLFKDFSPDIVLLDVMIPKLDGWGVLREIRTYSQTPVIMITAKGETTDKVSGLQMGADDYVVKPFEMKEVIARVYAVLRRAGGEKEQEKILTFDNLVINMESFELIVRGIRIDTPPKELELLYFLASSPNRVYTRDQLLDEVWGFDYFGDSRTVDVHVKRLREKLEGASEQWCLKTVWGVGYKFDLSKA
jgi:DNA-binding response OmpR family regulator